MARQEQLQDFYCLVPPARLRLQWHTLHPAAMSGKGGIDQRAAVKRLEETLGDAHAVRAQMDIVTHHAVDLVRFLTAPQSPARIRLAQAWACALAPLESDARLNLADQLAALRTRVRMSRLGEPDGDLRDLGGAGPHALALREAARAH